MFRAKMHVCTVPERKKPQFEKIECPTELLFFVLVLTASKDLFPIVSHLLAETL